MFPKSKKLLSAALLLTAEASAAQLVEHADHGHVEVNISVNEQNRLAVDGRRIANVVPSQKGVLTTIKDEALGALYFALADQSPNANHGTVTLFVTDDHGTVYKLILVPRPIAGEEIILAAPEQRATRTTVADVVNARATSYQRHIKDLILIMADPALSASIEAIPVNKEIPLWKEGRLVLLAKYLDTDMVGEKYRLTNSSPSNMLLVEQELYRRGVLAVSVEYHTLTQGDSTDIYIVRTRNENE
jgi:conjugal transfer pilus assembly protein TraK